MIDLQQPFVTQEQKFKYWQESKVEIKQLQLENKELRDALEYYKDTATDPARPRAAHPAGRFHRR